jgi:hypothetical protein
MPSIDYANVSRHTSLPSDESSYSKLLAIFNKQTGDFNSVSGRNESMKVFLKTTAAYKDVVLNSGSGTYERMAGCDLAAIFAPFVTVQGSGEFMPGLHKDFRHKFDDPTTPDASGYVTGFKVLPFHWNPEDTTNILVRTKAPSGDGLPYLISDEAPRGNNPDEYRDISNIRSVGLRLPTMGVGWGYTTDGQCIPSGSKTHYFKGDVQEGWQINPINYIAAPIDMRYDQTRNVWTGPVGFWAEILGSTSGTAEQGSKIRYKWEERKLTPSGYLLPFESGVNFRQGDYVNGTAFNINPSLTLASGTFVWIEPSHRADAYAFNHSDPKIFFILITASLQVTTHRWRYDWVEQELLREGVWVNKPGGRSTPTSPYAWNTIEANNSAVGIQGNGINLENLPDGFAVQPVPTSKAVLWAMEIGNADGESEVIFAYENGIDGTC